MAEGERTGSSASGRDLPRAPLGHLARLDVALDVSAEIDDAVRAVLRDLTALPGVRRVGVALTEGGGRRLRFTAACEGEAQPETQGSLEWCHIDAYDDVPLTDAVRTGMPVAGELDSLDARYAGLVERERAAGTRAMAALPLPGTGSPIGGLVVFWDQPPPRSAVVTRMFEAAARRTAEAVQRVRSSRYRELADELARTEADAASGAMTAALRLPPEPQAAGRARRFLRTELAGWEIDGEVVENAQLCLSEVVTNAISHAHTVADVRLSLLDGVLTVLVRDHGGQGDGEVVAPVPKADPLAVFGRGLMLVDALADRWGSERDAVGTTVWFALGVESAA